ncbi:MAG TPA: hypothetical protein VFT74_00765 [Isosphaeraceae bacterium]|nr:hypothetical protein [Isosphaeraceae bacterium]
MLEVSDRYWDADTWSAYDRGELGWPEGDYFFALETDARSSVVRCVDRCLEWGQIPRVPRVVAGTSDSLALSGLSKPLKETARPTAGGGGPSPLKPIWNAQERTLSYNGITCTSYAREGHRQFDLLDAFDSEGWPDRIYNPFNHIETLKNTVSDLNKKLREKGSPIRFRIRHSRVNWRAVEAMRMSASSVAAISSNSRNSQTIS